jgi:hypothetical protein
LVNHSVIGIIRILHNHHLFTKLGFWSWRFLFVDSQLVNSNQSIRYSMSWCVGWLTIVVRSPPARRSLSWIQSFVDWFMAPRKWGFNRKTKSTNYPDHGHHGEPPPSRKIPVVEPGIELGTSWLVFRSSDHQTTRLVKLVN